MLRVTVIVITMMVCNYSLRRWSKKSLAKRVS